MTVSGALRNPSQIVPPKKVPHIGVVLYKEILLQQTGQAQEQQGPSLSTCGAEVADV